MRFIVDIFIAIAIAAALGIGSAWYVIDRGAVFGTVTVGAWTAWPASGQPDADPYAVAWLARTGEVPLGAGEGIAFTATADSSGRPLTAACDYTVRGQTPAARLWTLAAYAFGDAGGAPAPDRSSINSRILVRQPDGSFAIALSPEVQPGNWVPLQAGRNFRLVLRLYDTPVTTGSRLTDMVLPEIVRGACR
ncbi:MAG TPA: DUF1214 domain-containing protein [Bauldia sp.]|nr:DUF1214 domain-containing protein [Bauldia sp.]